MMRIFIRTPQVPKLRTMYLTVSAAFGAIALLYALLFWLPVPLNAAPVVVTSGADCTTVTAVTLNECRALVALHDRTAGTQWLTRTNWLAFQDEDAPCNWYGVQCANGHVTELSLAANGLSGTLPITIGYLSKVTTLHLENNLLRGRVPPTICALTATTTDLNLAYNALLTQLRRVRSCLNQLDPDWNTTQTVEPRNLRLTEFYTDSLRLSWTPIRYTDDGGYYEIYVASAVDGPYLLHGTTTDKNSESYLVTGLTPGERYFFAVNAYTPPHGKQLNALRSQRANMVGVTKATAGNVLVAAYFPADNDLSTQIRYVVTRLRNGTQINPNVVVLLLVDGSDSDDTKILLIRDGKIITTSIVHDSWGRDELDTSDPAILSWFLQYARTNYPATKTVVSLIGHGLALAPELEWPDPAGDVAAAALSTYNGDKFPPLPRGWTDMPNDITDNSYMSTTDVGEALMAATADGADPFDVIFFDQCFQGNLDALYEVHQTAEVFVASPNYAWLVAAYDKYISGFSPNNTADELATHIINAYEDTLNSHHPNAIFSIRGQQVATVADAISNLGDALTLAVADGQVGRIANAVRQSEYVDTTQCGKQNLQLGPPDELIGIETFGQMLFNEFAATDSYGIVAALDQLRTAMSTVNKLSRSGNPYIAPDEFWDYTNSLTILTPLPRNSPAGVAWRASIYRPDAPFTATWTLDPTQPVTVTTSLAFVKEGRWDDFLATWFQGLSPTIGQWCHYMPPEQLLIGAVDPMTLTIDLDAANDLALQWTPTDDESATDYWLYVNGPDTVSWEVTQTMGISQTSSVFSAVASGGYEVKILARNEAQEIVAQSNIVAVDVPEVELPRSIKIFLPFVNR